MPQTRKGRKDIENSGYFRLLASSENDEIALELASILSENQSKVISNGNMLDSQIIPNPKFNPNNVKSKVKSTHLDSENCIGHYAHLSIMQEDCKSINKKCIQLDYAVIDETSVCIFEIKDGDNFDTKKSEGEVESLNKAIEYFAKLFPNKTISSHVVLWNARDKSKTSFKAKNIPNDFIMLGKEFCKKYNIDWDAITKHRMSLAEANKECIIKRFQEVLCMISKE